MADMQAVIKRYEAHAVQQHAQWMGRVIDLELRLEQVTAERNAALEHVARLQEQLGVREDTEYMEPVSVGRPPVRKGNGGNGAR